MKFRIDLPPKALFLMLDESVGFKQYLEENDPDTLQEIEQAMEGYNLIRRATKLEETDSFIAYEDPDDGDEAPIIIYSKVMSEVVGSGFYDLDDEEEINDFLDGRVNLHG